MGMLSINTNVGALEGAGCRLQRQQKHGNIHAPTFNGKKNK